MMPYMCPSEQPIRMPGMKIPVGAAVPEVRVVKMNQMKKNRTTSDI